MIKEEWRDEAHLQLLQEAMENLQSSGLVTQEFVQKLTEEIQSYK